MSDYTPVQSDFTAKDSLSVGDVNKLVLGADLDAEFAALQTAIATKYDITDLATQVQAEAGTNNTQFMTPLRVAQYVGQNAGVLVDILALTDPGADRILFWDESANNTTWLTVSTGLVITATTITTNDAAIVHDSLSGFVANEHIDHTAVTVTAGVGLSYSTGGTDISASATIDLDINELATETVLDIAADYVPVYDASAAVERKYLASTFVGQALGDGKWYRSSTQSLSAGVEATIVFNAAEYDALERGTFSTSTGTFTVGADAIRVYISAMMTIAAMNDDETMRIIVEVNGVEKLRHNTYNDTDNDTPEQTISVAGCLTLAASDAVTVRGFTSSAETISAGTQYTSVSIMELS